MENKWAEFNGLDYNIKNLGRPAVFHLPLRKLTKELKEELELFLVAHIGAYTFEGIPSFGAWINGRQIITKDECMKYEVSFV